MINRVFRKFNSLYLDSHVKSLGTLNTIKPFEKLDADIVAKNRKVLEPYFQEYLATVSVANMAASLELSAAILSVLQLGGYKRLADLGSGFTSFVLRYYAKANPGVQVVSVDDSAEWLEKTRAFLMKHNLGDSNMLMLEDFVNGKPTGFDCIVHDMNYVEVRINYVDGLFASLTPNGILILDDMHKPDYRHEIMRKTINGPFRVYTIRPLTNDSFGRYSMIALRP